MFRRKSCEESAKVSAGSEQPNFWKKNSVYIACGFFIIVVVGGVIYLSILENEKDQAQRRPLEEDIVNAQNLVTQAEHNLEYAQQQARGGIRPLEHDPIRTRLEELRLRQNQLREARQRLENYNLQKEMAEASRYQRWQNWQQQDQLRQIRQIRQDISLLSL